MSQSAESNEGTIGDENFGLGPDNGSAELFAYVVYNDNTRLRKELDVSRARD